MSLETLFYNIGQIALKNNLVNSYFAGGSLYEINAEIVKEYPLIFITPAGDHIMKENTTRFSLTIYYADRLWDDDRNETDICSVAIETLKNLKRQLYYLDWVANVQEEPIIRLFTETEKMNDRLAGAYMNVWVEVLNASTCAEFLDELGRPLGNYIPGNINVLDGYATKAWVTLQNYADKPWVLEQLQHVSGGTVDPEYVKELVDESMSAYTLTKDFATINGSRITNGDNFRLVEQDEFNETVLELQDAIGNISGVSMDDLRAIQADLDDLSGATVDIERSIGNVSGLSADLVELSGATEDLSRRVDSLSGVSEEELLELSAATVALESRVDSLSGASQEDIVALSAATVALEQRVDALSGASQEDLLQLSAATVSGFTELSSEIGTLSGLSSLTALTTEIQTLSGATVGLEGDIQDLSGATSGLSSDLAALSGSVANKQDALTAGTNITIQNNVISAAGNVSSSTIYYLVTLTQTAYDNLQNKDNNTLYIIVN